MDNGNSGSSSTELDSTNGLTFEYIGENNGSNSSNRIGGHNNTYEMGTTNLLGDGIEDGGGEGTTDLTIPFGVLIVLLGAFCFGTMHVPIRKFSTGNYGIFVQWIMSFGSLIVGFVVNMAMGSPPVQLLATGGGVLWTFANSIAQFVISGLGLAPALLLWSTTNILTGWSAGRFGLFGLKQKLPEHDLMNIVGLITIISGGICFAFIKKSLLLPPGNKQVHVYPRSRSMNNSMGLFEAEEDKNAMTPNPDGQQQEMSRTSSEADNAKDVFELNQQQHQQLKTQTTARRKSSLEQPAFFLSFPEIMVTPIEGSTEGKKEKKQQRFQFDSNEIAEYTNSFSSPPPSFSPPSSNGPIAMGNQCWSKRFRKWMMRNSHRLLCICLTLISGFFYAATVIPVIYIQDNPENFPGAPHSGLNYIFSHYFGIFIGATSIFVIYAGIKHNKPTINAEVILPSLLSGALWGCGMVCLFLSNDLLTQTITYPVLITIPGCVAALWSIFYFKEIQLNRKNKYIIAIAFALIFTGAFLVFLSKSTLHFDDDSILPKFV